MYQESIQARFHHLADIQEFMTLGHRKYLKNEKIVWDAYQKESMRSHFSEWYYRDVMGSPKNQEQYIKRVGTVLLQCLTSPDLTPFMLMAVGRDFICQLCVHGEHCNTPDGVKDVIAITERLETTISRYNILGPFVRMGDISDSSSFTVHTNMSVVRSIIRVDKDLARFIRS